MSSDHVPAVMQRRVRERAGGRCEYCGLSQEYQEATFHIDHITPRVGGGVTVMENLALACVSCSLRKGARREATDPESGAVVMLFNPRRDTWDEHFRLDAEGRLEGSSATGRATAELLKMNRPLAVALRREAVARAREGR